MEFFVRSVRKKKEIQKRKTVGRLKSSWLTSGSTEALVNIDSVFKVVVLVTSY